MATQTTGPAEALDQDLSHAIVSKIDQIDTTLALAVAGTPTIQRIYPVVVMSGPLPMTPITEARIRRMVASKERAVVGSDPRCRPIGVLELYELKMFFRTIIENGISAANLLEAWLGSAMGGNNFRDWLLSQSVVIPGRSLPGDDWEDRVHAIFSSPQP